MNSIKEDFFTEATKKWNKAEKTKDALKEIARAIGYTGGKWMIRVDLNHVDSVWSKVSVHVRDGSFGPATTYANVTPIGGMIPKEKTALICVFNQGRKRFTRIHSKAPSALYKAIFMSISCMCKAIHHTAFRP